MLLHRLLTVPLLVAEVAQPAIAQPPSGNHDLWKECRNQQIEKALGACTQIIDNYTESGARLA